METQILDASGWTRVLTPTRSRPLGYGPHTFKMRQVNFIWPDKTVYYYYYFYFYYYCSIWIPDYLAHINYVIYNDALSDFLVESLKKILSPFSLFTLILDRCYLFESLITVALF